MKLGRIRLKVKDYRLENSGLEEEKQEIQEDDELIDCKKCDDRPKDGDDSCRICFYDTNTTENPLFSPCKCTGSVKFIHFDCLKKWLNQKLALQQIPNLQSYYWKSFDCELCKATYPCIFSSYFLVCIEHVGTKYPLADIYKPPKGDFILLESLVHEKNASRIVNVIMPSEEKNVFKLGRGHEADVRISDISVSRFHAQLRCAKDGYYIEDNNSKFGTLALISSLEISPNLTRAIQVGRTIIGLKVKQVELET